MSNLSAHIEKEISYKKFYDIHLQENISAVVYRQKNNSLIMQYAKYTLGFAGAKSTHFLFKLDSKKFHGFFFS